MFSIQIIGINQLTEMMLNMFHFLFLLVNPNTFANISLTLKFDNSRSATGPSTGEVMYRFG